jgi:hypothetical protein
MNVTEKRDEHPTDQRYLKLIEPYLLRIFDEIRETKSYELLHVDTKGYAYRNKDCRSSVAYKTVTGGFHFYDENSSEPDFMICAVLADEFQMSYTEVTKIISDWKDDMDYEEVDNQKFWV